MAKNLALLALLLGVAALFLPLSQTPDGSITKGVLMGTMKETAGLLFIAPQSLAALFGATLGRKRFGRGPERSPHFWNRTLHLSSIISGLIDPRQGRRFLRCDKNQVGQAD